MAEEPEEEAASEEQTPQGEPARGPQLGQPQARQVRLNLEGVQPEYANFCSLAARQSEVFMSFGRAFAPAEEMKVDTQIVMSVDNIRQLHQALGRLLEHMDQTGPGR